MSLRILLLMAGGDQLFKEAGFPFPKNLTEINGMPLVQHVIGPLQPLIQPDTPLYALIRKEENRRHFTGAILQLLIPQTQVIEVQETTRGAACTALLAIEHMNNDDPLLVCNGDIIVEVDLPPVIADFQKRGLDGGIIVFEGVHPRWSYVRCDERGDVIEAAEKRPISKLATAGLYYFARGKDFVASVTDMIVKEDQLDGNYYISPSFNQMVLRQKRVGIFKIPREKYFSLATPQGVDAYEQHLRKS